jgi:hypothetical protein
MATASPETWTAFLQAHDCNLDGDRLDLEVRIKISVTRVDGELPRQTATDEALRSFAAIGLGPILDRPDIRISLSVSLGG